MTNCEKKQVEVEIQYGDTLTITVQDTGKGIQEEEIGALFTKLFHKGDNRGYNLYLVKRKYTANKWENSCVFISRKGTTITIEIPKGRDEANMIKVLIVEDDPMVAMLNTHYLEQAGGNLFKQ